MTSSFSNRFFLSHGVNAFTAGIHLVLLSWIAVGVLNVSGAELGWIQGAALLPNLFFLLIAGVWCDRFKSERVMALALVLNGCAYLMLALIIYLQWLSYEYLIVYGVLVGIGNAFIQPSREKLLSTMNTYHVQKRISIASILQFSLQSLGILFASSSDILGFELIVFAQGICSFISALLVYPFYPFSSENRSQTNEFKRDKKSLMVELLIGIKKVRASKGLQQLMILIGFNGYMHLGVYVVVMPLLAKNSYGFSAAEYGGLQLTFLLGMVAAHFQLIYKDTIEYPGQGALFSLLYTAIIGYALMKQPTLYGLFFIVFSWGYVAGNSAGRCRLVAQALTSDSLKGRIMSIYQFVLFGFASLGALVTGFFVSLLKLEQLFYVMSISSIAMFVFFIFTRSLWNVKQ